MGLGLIYTVTNHGYNEVFEPPERRSDAPPWCSGWRVAHVDYQDRGVAVVWSAETSEEHDTLPSGLAPAEEGGIE